MQIYLQLELNKLLITNSDQVFYEHAKFKVIRQLSSEIKENPLLRGKEWKNTTWERGLIAGLVFIVIPVNSQNTLLLCTHTENKLAIKSK